MLSTCVKCNNSLFEVVEAEPAGCKSKVLFVQCSRCGGVVGVLADTAAVRTIEKDVRDLKKEVQKIMFRLS